MNELNPYIKRIAHDYFGIGLELDIVNSTLRIIQQDSKFSGLEEKCREMLNAWLQTDTCATWEKLCIALERREQQVLAKEIRELSV